MITFCTSAEFDLIIEGVGRTEYNIILIQEVGSGGGGSSLPANQTDALDNANNPSGANPFATVGDIPDLTGYATETFVTGEIANIPTYDPSLRIVNIEEGSNIILDADSGNTYYRYKGASPITVTVPNTIPVALPFAINQMGVGKITLQGASGVVLSTANLKTGGQGFGVTIMKVANNLVDIIGGIE